MASRWAYNMHFLIPVLTHELEDALTFQDQERIYKERGLEYFGNLGRKRSAGT